MGLARKFHEMYAKANGYFWMPCLICGEMFGGHEEGTGALYYIDDPQCGKSVCPKCATTAAHINARHYPDRAVPIHADASYETRERVAWLLEHGLMRSENQKTRST